MSMWSYIGDLMTHPAEILGAAMYGTVPPATERYLQSELATSMRKAGATQAQIDVAAQQLHAQIAASNAKSAAESPVPGGSPTQLFYIMVIIALVALVALSGFFVWKATK